jgi:hypothetical protein
MGLSRDQDDLFNAFEEGIEQTIAQKIKKGTALTPTEKEILEGKEAIIQGDFVDRDGSKPSTVEIIEDTLKNGPQTGGMQTGFTLDWTGVYKPILTVFNGDKRKGKKTRKGKGRKHRKATRKAHRKH